MNWIDKHKNSKRTVPLPHIVCEYCDCSIPSNFYHFLQTLTLFSEGNRGNLSLHVIVCRHRSLQKGIYEFLCILP